MGSVMMIDQVTEMMFAQGVALSQNGKMKSTCHCGGKDIFILNKDNTILLKYKSPQEFEESFSFTANDYEAPRIKVEDGKLMFISNANGLRRTKVCPPPKTTFGEVKGMWEAFQVDRSNPIPFTKDMVSLLDDGLSHIEISKEEGGQVKLIQRDIYSGSRIEVERNKSNAGLLDTDDFVFGPIGIRTVDFGALFTFADSLTWFIQQDKNWLYFEDNTGRLSGIIAQCLYDELGTLSICK